MNLMVKKKCVDVPPMCRQLVIGVPKIANWQHEKCQLPIGNTRSANYQLAARQHLNSDSSQQTTNLELFLDLHQYP